MQAVTNPVSLPSVYCIGMFVSSLLTEVQKNARKLDFLHCYILLLLLLLLLLTPACFDGDTRHCATNRKVASSIPDVVSGIFPLLNPSGRTMALGSTQPLTEMSTSDISLGVKVVGA